MPEITVMLTEQQQREVEEAARLTGRSVAECAAEAVSRAIEARYVLPSVPGQVMAFQALKRERQ